MRKFLNYFPLAITVLITVFVQGCAVFGNKLNTTQIEGNPAKAKVYYNGLLAGQTPCKIYIPSKDLRPHKLNANISLIAEGYDPKSMKLKPIVRPEVLAFDALSLLSLNPLFLLVDYTLGVMFKPENKIDYQLNQNK